MLNRESIEAVAAARIDEHLAVPLYTTYGFARVPAFVRSLFEGGPLGLPAAALGPLPRDVRVVITILLDGFGWSYFERFAGDLPFLKRALDEGVVSKLTTQFPATTAAHITTLHTGHTVGASGVFEWFYYEPSLDAVFAPLLHATVGPDGLVPVPDPAPDALFPPGTLYEALAAIGVTARCHQPARYARSPYSLRVTRGAEITAYRTLPEGVVNLAAAARAARGPTYHCFYADVVDGTSHGYGPRAPHVEAEVRAFFHLLEDVLAKGLGERTLVVLTADHGHMEVDPERTLYVDEVLPECMPWMKTSREGRPIVPGGSARDLFLYVEERAIDEAEARLARALEGRATVHRTRDLIRDGFFGPDAGPRLVERAGDLAVLPRAGEMVYVRAGGRFLQHKRGHHGGLSADEIEIPLVVWAT